MQDCRKGKIDRILVKSISRFARNTKDCLAAVRELKELGVSVQFEEQGIDTSKVSSEMVTAIMASLAQKGSESISGNVQWGYQKRMESGKFNTCKAPYGFTLHEGKLSIKEDEATVVRFIFQLYLNGLNGYEIANTLSQQEIPPGREMGTWKDSSIYYILKNERYAGKAMVGKSYSTTTFPHKKVRNHGEREMYLMPDSNPPIVSPEIFDRVRALLQSRKTSYNGSTNQPFSRKLYCANCGRSLKRKFTNKKMYWVCNTHFQNAALCPTPPYHTPDIEQAFCRLYYKLKHHGSSIFTQMLSNLQKIRYARMLWSEDVISLNKKISDTLSQVQFLAQLQQSGGVDPDTFISSNNKLSEQLRRLKQEKARLLDTDSDELADRTRDLMDALEDGPDFLDSFDAELFDALVEKIIVDSNERLRFRLKNGLELTEQIERTRR